MELAVYNLSGAKTGKTVTVDEAIFGIEPHEHAMWLAIKATLANRRARDRSSSSQPGSFSHLDTQPQLPGEHPVGSGIQRIAAR